MTTLKEKEHHSNLNAVMTGSAGLFASIAAWSLVPTQSAIFVSMLAGACFMLSLLSIMLARSERSLRKELEAGNYTITYPRSPLRPEHAVVELLSSYASKAQLEAKHQADAYQLLTGNIAAAVVTQDAQGRITFCSPYTEVLTGYARKDILAIEKDFFSTIVHGEDGERYGRAFNIARLGEAFQFRYRILHKTGIEIWVESRIVPILDEKGEVSMTLAVTLDVTGTVRYQRQVEEKNRDLQDFTYLISHDLKAPIFTIKGMVDLLKEDLGSNLSTDTQETLDHISSAARRLEQLVSSVLEYSRISAQDIATEPVPLQQVLQEVRDDLQHQINSAKALLHLPQEAPTVLGERLRIYQIFVNLVGNAIKYRDPQRPAEITIKVLPSRSDREARIAVSDNGLGIPEDKRSLLFRPFQRLHKSKNIEGTGIGLASVKKLLEKLGGSIEFEGGKENGSTFIVTLQKAPTSASPSLKGLPEKEIA